MQAEKRMWICRGLGVPEGSGLCEPVRPTVKRLHAPRRVLLVGDDAAQGLMPPLMRLAVGSGVQLHFDARPGSTARQWAHTDWLKVHLSAFEPTMVFFALDPRDVLARRCIRARVRSAGARTLWLVPPGVPHAPSVRFIGADSDDAAGYAAWAARAWTVVK